MLALRIELKASSWLDDARAPQILRTFLGLPKKPPKDAQVRTAGLPESLPLCFSLAKRAVNKLKIVKG